LSGQPNPAPLAIHLPLEPERMSGPDPLIRMSGYEMSNRINSIPHGEWHHTQPQRAPVLKLDFASAPDTD
jgi:hypothetical protein